MDVIGRITVVPQGVQWAIPDFLSLQGRYKSPSFPFYAASWELGIEVWHTYGRNIRLILWRTTRGPPLRVQCSTSVKCRDGRKHGEEKRTKDFDDDRVWFYPGLIQLESHGMREFLTDGTLTVLCTLKQQERNAEAKEISTVKENNACATNSEILEDKEPSSSQETGDSKPKTSGEGSDSSLKSSCHLHKNKVLLDLKELFLKKEDCDVVIKVKGQEFPAHKIILKTRSPVFASTFRCDMKEKATGIVDVEDCDPSSFSDFLCYLYCGAVENLSEQNVFSLFTAADKYDVQDLREECLRFMKENLSVHTFCDTLTLALRHSETELIQLTTDFFTKNAPKIIVTVQWQNFSADNPTESNELFIKLLVPNKN